MSVQRTVVIATLLAVLIGAETTAYFTVPVGGTALDGKLDKVNEKTVDLLVDLAKLFITFAYGILGAIAFFVTKADEIPVYKTTAEFTTITGAATAAVSSIYWGHLLLTSIIEMLSNDFLDLRSPRIVWSVRLQYMSVLVAALLLVTYAVARSERVAERESQIVIP